MALNRLIGHSAEGKSFFLALHLLNVGYEVKFPDYRADELLEIFKRLAQEAGYHVSAAAGAQAKTYLQGRREQDGSSFGNARTVEQLF